MDYYLDFKIGEQRKSALFIDNILYYDYYKIMEVL